MILWHGEERSTHPARMSVRKRLRVLWAALTQTWHTKTCAECGADWMAVGPQTDLIAMCDACEVQQMDKFAADMERKYQQEILRGDVA